MHPVKHLTFSLAALMPPITYGVLPEAVIPITVSSSVMLYADRSLNACSVSSSANSYAILIALSPPAMILCLI